MTERINYQAVLHACTIIIIKLMKLLACKSLRIRSVLNKAQQLAHYYRRESWWVHFVAALYKLFFPSLLSPTRLVAFATNVLRSRVNRMMYVNSICRFPRTFLSNFSLPLFFPLHYLSLSLFLVFIYSLMHVNSPCPATLVSPVFPLPSIQPRRMADSNRNEIVCKLICPRASWERSARTYM